MDNSIHQQILLKIQATEPGTVLFTTDFMAEGTDDAIHKTLSRLVRPKLTHPLGNSHLLKPKNETFLWPFSPFPHLF